MSLARLAARQAVICALAPPVAPGGAEPTWPTIAGKWVFDSRMVPIHDLQAQAQHPVITVETVDGVVWERGEHNGVEQGGWAATVVSIEIAIPMFKATREGIEVGYPATDADLAAQLDLLEHQVRAAITKSRYVRVISPWGVSKIETTSYWSDDQTVQLAARRIDFALSIFDDMDWAQWGAPPAAVADLISLLPDGSRPRVLLETMGRLSATPSQYDSVVLDVRVALDFTGGDQEATSVSAQVVLDPDGDAVGIDPAVTGPQIPPEQAPEVDESWVWRDPFTAPKTIGDIVK